ncbi:MAG TPA: hypothetical protein VF585_06320 [Chthoniobacterales bacterium]
MSIHRISSLSVAVTTLLLGIKASHAVQVFTTNPAGQDFYESAPPNELGFSYTGTVNSASGVYLGNYNGTYYVLTADHVGGGDFTLGATTYSQVANSYMQIAPGVDLGVFAITATDTTQLDALTNLVLSSGGAVGSDVNMIGYGGGEKRGGFNTVDSRQPLTYMVNGESYAVQALITDFDSVEGQAQAIGLDSGGGVFRASSSGTFQLDGIMVVEGTRTNGDQTQTPITGSVDIATYRQAILVAIPEASSVGMLLIGGLFAGGVCFFRSKTRKV